MNKQQLSKHFSEFLKAWNNPNISNEHISFAIKKIDRYLLNCHNKRLCNTPLNKALIQKWLIFKEYINKCQIYNMNNQLKEIKKCIHSILY